MYIYIYIYIERLWNGLIKTTHKALELWGHDSDQHHLLALWPRYLIQVLEYSPYGKQPYDFRFHHHVDYVFANLWKLYTHQ